MPLRKMALLFPVLMLGVGSSNASANVYQLSCSGKLTSITDAPEYTVLRRLKLDGSTLSLQVEYGIRSYALRSRNATLYDSPGMGFAFDDQPLVMTRALFHGTQALLDFSFYAIRKGTHRITVGIVDPKRGLAQANSFCFSSPGYFSRTGSLYL
jgi:hypothetical protein